MKSLALTLFTPPIGAYTAAMLLLLGAGAPLAAQPSRDPEPVDMTITHLGPGAWQAEYRWTTDAEAACFQRDRWAFRSEQWEVRTPGLRLARQGSRECIESVDGRSFRTVAVRFPSDPTKRDREYPLTQHFTDGSDALFTGLLYLDPIDGEVRRPTTARLRLVPAPGESLVLHGRHHGNGTRWTDETRGGTFAYFGAIKPIESAGLMAIVDPGLPDHLGAQFHEQLPALFEWYTERLGYPLERTPLILIGYEPTTGEQRGSSGDVLPGLIRFALYGPGWEAADDSAYRGVFYLLAHEAAHLWNGDLFQSAENAEAPWMHEGGAEALAWLAMRRFGVTDDADFRGQVEDALNQCLSTSRGGALHAVMRSSRTPYTCGAIINLMVGAEVSVRDGLTAFWRALFAAAEPDGRRYDSARYFTTLEAMTGDRRLATFLRQWLHDSIPKTAAALLETLSRAGIDAAITASPPDRVAGPLLRNVAAALMERDCGGRFSISGVPEGLQIHGVPGCATLPESGGTVTALESVSLTTSPGAAYAAIAERCARGEAVRLTVAERTEPVSLPCPAAVPPYVRVLAVPGEPTR